MIQRSHSFIASGTQTITDDSTARSLIVSVLQSLRESGLYWRGLSKEGAESLLNNANAGTFLIRDSSHPMYLFTLTVKTAMGVTNIRIAMEKGRFRLESYAEDATKTLNFENVLQLITYYMCLSKKTLEKDSAGSTRRSNQLYLEKPLYKRVCSLQHICRRTIHRNLNQGGILQLPIPDTAKVYISKHPFPV